MTGKAHIRVANAADTEALAALAARTFEHAFAGENAAGDIDAYVRESFSQEQVHAELADPRNLFMLAFAGENDSPVGYAKLRAGTPEASVKGPDPVELHRIYVDRSALGRGVGAALMRAVLEAARRGGHRTLWLGVWERNERAIAFYRQWGFEAVGEHLFLLGSDEQTDLIMERPCELSYVR